MRVALARPSEDEGPRKACGEGENDVDEMVLRFTRAPVLSCDSVRDAISNGTAEQIDQACGGDEGQDREASVLELPAAQW